jgi:hypothetical protein
MKHLFKRIVLFIGTSALIFSCSRDSSLSFTKRHYRNGYYVEYADKKSTLKLKAHETALTEEPTLTSQKTIGPKVERNLIIKDGNTNESKGGIVSKNKSTSTKGINLKLVTERPSLLLPATHSKTNTPIYKFHVKGVQDTTNEDVRSFFWTVILVILVLWLIAVLTGGWGLGGLVHLFLVVALILFILWLLRII